MKSIESFRQSHIFGPSEWLYTCMCRITNTHNAKVPFLMRWLFVYLQQQFAELVCEHLRDPAFHGDCGQYLSDSISPSAYYHRCVADMCYVPETPLYFCPMCRITADMARECGRSPGKVYLDWDMYLHYGFNYSLKTECGKILYC